VPLAGRLSDRLDDERRNSTNDRVGPWSATEAEWRYQADILLDGLVARYPDIPRERIRWNAYRHTFGSLLAQDGVSLDKISAWMGNSPAVCRRHYAEFVPRDRRDEDIDRL